MNSLAKGDNNGNDPRNNGKGNFYEDEDPTTPLKEALEMVKDAEDDAGDALRQLFASPYNINANNSNNSNNAAAIVSAEEAANSAREATVAVLKAAINASAEVSNSIKAANKAKAAMNKLRERAAFNRDEEEKTRKELEALMAILGAGGELIKIGGKRAGAKLVEAAGGVLTAAGKVTGAVARNAVVPAIGAALGGVKAALAMLEGATLVVLRGADDVAGKALMATGRVTVAGLRAAGRGAKFGLRVAGEGAMNGLRVAGNAATRRLNAFLSDQSPPNQPVPLTPRGRAGSPKRRGVASPAPVAVAPLQYPAAAVDFQLNPLIAAPRQPNPPPTMAPQASTRFTGASAAPPPPPPQPSSTSTSFNPQNIPRNVGPPSPGPSSGAAPGDRIRQRAGPNQGTLRAAGVPVHANLEPGARFRPGVVRGVRGAPLVPMSVGSRAPTMPSESKRRGTLEGILRKDAMIEEGRKIDLVLNDSQSLREMREEIIAEEKRKGLIDITRLGGTRKASHKKRNNTKRRK